jgi:hypothetical protein
MDQQDQSSSLFEMEVDTGAQAQLLAIAKWARFIAMTVFIGVGLFLLLLAGNAGKMSQSFNEIYSVGVNSGEVAAMVIIILVALTIVVLWVFFLFRGARLIKRGVYTKNPADLADGFKSLKIYFIFSMILSILGILNTFSTMAG